MSITIRRALSVACANLKSVSPSSRLDAEVLLSFILRKDKSYLYANPDKKLTRLQVSSFKTFIRKRAKNWPIAYLTGHKEFFGLDLRVTPAVLIPRPDTELLVERALQILKATSYKLKAVIDLGAGSGNIIISIVHFLSQYNRLVYDTTQFFAIDSSPKALAIARHNARRLGVAKKIKFFQDNLLSPFLKSYKLQANTLVLANLPYLTPQQHHSNPDLKHGPCSALVGGKDGLKYFRGLFEQLKILCHCEESARGGRRSNPKEIATRPADARNDIHSITLLLEHDPTQKQKLQTLVKKDFPKAPVRFHKDLSGKWRVMEFKGSYSRTKAV